MDSQGTGKNTKSSIVFYAAALFMVSLLPFAIGMSGPMYLVSAIALGAWFLHHTWVLKYRPKPDSAIRTFAVSIYYLFGLFAALMIDHYLPPTT